MDALTKSTPVAGRAGVWVIGTVYDLDTDLLGYVLVPAFVYINLFCPW